MPMPRCILSSFEHCMQRNNIVDKPNVHVCFGKEGCISVLEGSYDASYVPGVSISRLGGRGRGKAWGVGGYGEVRQWNRESGWLAYGPDTHSYMHTYPPALHAIRA